VMDDGQGMWQDIGIKLSDDNHLIRIVGKNDLKNSGAPFSSFPCI
jgi:hypothetical protein